MTRIPILCNGKKHGMLDPEDYSYESRQFLQANGFVCLPLEVIAQIDGKADFLEVVDPAAGQRYSCFMDQAMAHGFEGETHLEVPLDLWVITDKEGNVVGA